MTLGPGPLEYLQAFALVFGAGLLVGFVLGWRCRAPADDHLWDHYR